jgi:hypothetical protein
MPAAVSRPAKTRAARASMEIVVKSDPKGSGAWHTVTFGDVTVTGPRPSDEEIRRNVEASTEALRRALPAFLRPGIRIYPKKDVPLFWADEDNPKDGVIRKLNGKIERGVVDEDGNFKVID